jgi:hypothetical protein
VSAIKQALECLAQIAAQMKPIGNLDCLGRTGGGTSCKDSCPVAADDLDARMSAQPLGEGVVFTIG